MDRPVSEKKEEKNTDKVEPPKPEDVPSSLYQPLLLCQSPPMSSGTSNTVRVEQELLSCVLECSSGAAASATSSSVSTPSHFDKDTSKSPFLVANTSDDKVEDSDEGNCTKRVDITLARDNDVTNWRRKRVYHRAPKERITAGMELSLQETELKEKKIQEESASNSDSNPPPPVEEVQQVSQEDQDLIDFEGILSRLITYTAPGSRVPSERRFYVYTELVTEKKAQYYSEKLTTLNRRFKNETDPFLKKAVVHLRKFYEEIPKLRRDQKHENPKKRFKQSDSDNFNRQLEGSKLLEDAIIRAKCNKLSIRELCLEVAAKRDFENL